MPLSVSVIIPVYNRAATVAAAIRSVLQQSEPAAEVLVIDDGSTDRSSEVIAGFGEAVRYVRQENGGVSTARNHGVRLARHAWIAFLDSDDLWYPHRLAAHRRLIERHPELRWLAGGFETFAGSRRLRVSPPAVWAAELAGGVIEDAVEWMARGLRVWTGTITVHRDALQCVGLFDEQMRKGQDMDLWIRLAVDFPRLGFDVRPLARYQVGDASSVTATAAAQGNPQWLLMIERIMSLARMCDGRRSQLLRQLAAFKVTQMARNCVRAANPRSARWFLQEARSLGVTGIPWWWSWISRAPAPVLRQMRRLRRRRHRDLSESETQL